MHQDALKRKAYSIAAMRRLAQRRLPRAVFDFVDGGAEDEGALGRNESALAQTHLLPHPLHGTSSRDQSVELFGTKLNLPVLIGPTGLAGMMWPRGEISSARAALGSRHRLHHEPRIDGVDRGLGARSRRRSVDAGVSSTATADSRKASPSARMPPATRRWC